MFVDEDVRIKGYHTGIRALQTGMLPRQAKRWEQQDAFLSKSQLVLLPFRTETGRQVPRLNAGKAKISRNGNFCLPASIVDPHRWPATLRRDRTL